MSCKSTIRFESVIGTGRGKFRKDEAEKRQAMDIIRIELEYITGKRSGY